MTPNLFHSSRAKSGANSSTSPLHSMTTQDSVFQWQEHDKTRDFGHTFIIYCTENATSVLLLNSQPLTLKLITSILYNTAVILATKR